jgi:5-methylcytosine-specific restriction endonuclease McrA
MDRDFSILHQYPNSQIALCSLSWLEKNVHTPEYQRYKSDDRISEIIVELSKKKEPTGIIILGKLKNKYYIIDGQHRCEGYKRLLIDPILLQILQIRDDEEQYETFCAINKMVPVEPYVHLARSHPERKRMLERLYKFIEENYKEFLSRTEFKDSLFRFPNINFHIFKDHVPRFPFYPSATYDNIIEKFLEFNEKCKSELGEKDIDTIHKKKSKNGHYLYISKSLRQVMKEVLKDDDDRKIDDSLRDKVWEKRNGKLKDGMCFCCQKNLNFKRFECGHIIAYSEGGRTELDNLEPICKNCNVKSQARNLLEYKNSLVV